MSEDKKFLVFDVSNEHGYMVAVIEWSPERVALIKRRMGTADRLRDEDDCFAWLDFHDAVDVYERSDEIEDWLVRHGDIDDCLWLLVEQDVPAFSPRRRVSGSYLHVDGESCFWSINLKHSDERHETNALYTSGDSTLFTMFAE